MDSNMLLIGFYMILNLEFETAVGTLGEGQEIQRVSKSSESLPQTFFNIFPEFPDIWLEWSFSE